ncbi:MAG: SDR family NAD(P)-dependent oxidoreductase [Deltaproteobacteria bacterium]|nr:SDR family NAD(P)-dependent oxidoreductase [Deltaproteobacteria bacterium]
MENSRQVAVVTGGASGIGLGIVRRLSERGMAVVAADWNAAACADAAASLDGDRDRTAVVEADVGTEAGAAEAVETAVTRFGRIDLLCNNAAIHPIATVEEMDVTAWNEAFRVNVTGALLCSRRVLPHMKKQGAGSIVNIGSVSGVAPYVGGGAYAVTKAALAMLTRVLALEAGPSGITVNCIAPGSIQHRTPGGGNTSHIPVGRGGTIDDVASLVLYLASAEARYMTGATLVLDGGATAGRKRAGAAVERLPDQGGER